MLNSLETTPTFDHDLKKLFKKHYDKQALTDLLTAINNNDVSLLKQKYRFHTLTGDRAGIYDVHVVSYLDWILLYTIVDNTNGLLLATGSHAILNRSYDRHLT